MTSGRAGGLRSARESESFRIRMAARTIRTAAAALVLLVASCGNDPEMVAAGNDAPPTVPRVKSGEMFDDDSQAMLERYGATNPLHGRGRAPDAGEAGADQFRRYQGAIAERDAGSQDYERKAFWGSKDYAAKVYQGDLDGSRHVRTAPQNSGIARENFMVSDEGQQGFATGGYAAGAARENGAPSINRKPNDRVNNRAERYVPPEIQDWRPQRALTVEDTKGMLGR